MSLFDLHVHSTASDGTCFPTEVVQLAKKAGLAGIALTDHDTVDGVEEAIIEGNKIGIQVISGIEFSTNYKNVDVHILGLGFDYKDDIFLAEVEELKDSRTIRNEKMLNKLNQMGYEVTLQDLYHSTEDAVITRAHFARSLVDKGYYPSTKDVFDKLLGTGRPGYIPRTKVTPENVIQIVKKAGGFAVLAHPMLYEFTYDELNQLIKHLIPFGLDGIEAIYSTNNEEEEHLSRELANKNNLYITAGSDFHGDNRPDISIGYKRGPVFFL